MPNTGQQLIELEVKHKNLVALQSELEHQAASAKNFAEQLRVRLELMKLREMLDGLATRIAWLQHEDLAQTLAHAQEILAELEAIRADLMTQPLDDDGLPGGVRWKLATNAEYIERQEVHIAYLEAKLATLAGHSLVSEQGMTA